MKKKSQMVDKEKSERVDANVADWHDMLKWIGKDQQLDSIISNLARELKSSGANVAQLGDEIEKYCMEEDEQGIGWGADLRSVDWNRLAQWYWDGSQSRKASYSHSFTPEFYGNIDDAKPSQTPTTVADAIASLSEDELDDIRDEFFPTAREDLPKDILWQAILDMIIETNTVGSLDSPVDVWIDPEGYHTVLVFDPIDKDAKMEKKSGFESDDSVAQELIDYGYNTSEIYNQRFIPIIKNLYRKVKKGTYNPTLAIKLWMYWVEDAAKGYIREFADPKTDKWFEMFPKDIRQLAAKKISELEYENIQSGEYDNMFAKKETKEEPEVKEAAAKQKREKTFDDLMEETALIPELVAESVIGEISGFLHSKGEEELSTALYELTSELSEAVSNTTLRLYNNNPKFAAQLKGRGNRGRDQLYAYMRHWLSAELKDRKPEIFKLLPQDFLVGHELMTPVQGLTDKENEDWKKFRQESSMKRQSVTKEIDDRLEEHVANAKEEEEASSSKLTPAEQREIHELEGSVKTADLKLGESDKRVIESFVDKRADEGNKLATDGKSLDGIWFGGRGIAKWVDDKIFINDLGSRSAQTVQYYLEIATPKSFWGGHMGISEERNSEIYKKYPKREMGGGEDKSYGPAKKESKVIPSKNDPFKYNQHKICVDTVKNPMKALLGGPSVAEAKKTLKDKFSYTDEEIAALEKFDKESSMEKQSDFMEPQVYEGDFLMVDGHAGTEWLDSEYVNASEVEQLKKEIEAKGKASLKGTSLADYFENSLGSGEIFDIEMVHGFGALMSAPGYLDRTPLTVFKTEEEALKYLEEMYGDEDFEDEEDLEDELDGTEE